jgi:hypothetical protein
VRPADLPSQADAERTARQLLSAAGFNLEGATITSQDGYSDWVVDVSPRVGGLPTLGWSWSVVVGPHAGIVNAHGQLAVARKLGDYPLVGTAVGLQRLHDDRWFGGPMPMMGMNAQPAGVPDMACAPNASCPAPPAVIITGAHLALAFNSGMLVPVYVFETADGVAGAVPAVTDAHLLPPAATVPDQPTPGSVPPAKGAPTPAPAPAPPTGAPGSTPCGPAVAPGGAAPQGCR